MFGKEFTGQTGSAYKHGSDVAMRVFYATKMMAKPLFLLGQILYSPMIIPELSKNYHGIQAIYSFGKASIKLLIGDKELWNHIKEISQEYNTIEAQFLESLNLEKHQANVSKAKAVMYGIEDYVLLGKPGKGLDSLSRLISYASAYTHYIDLGIPKARASEAARLAADRVMNMYDSVSSAPIFENLGIS